MWMFLFFNLIEAYQYDDVTVITLDEFGKNKITSYLNFIDIYDYLNLASDVCDKYRVTTYGCDAVIHMRLCMLKREYYKSNVSEKFSQYSSINAFLQNGSFTPRTTEKIDQIFNCGIIFKSIAGYSVRNTSLPDLENKTADIAGIYSDKLHLSTWLIEENFEYKNKFHNFFPLLNASILKFLKHPGITHISFESVSLSIKTYVKFGVQSVCNPHHYGKKCWFECKETISQVCKCTSTKNLDLDCEIICKRNWAPSTVIYKIKNQNFSVTMNYCNRIDTCLKTICKPLEDCFIISNTSASCMFYTLDFIQNDLNVTKNTFILDKYVYIKITNYNNNIKMIDLADLFLLEDENTTNSDLFRLYYYPHKIVIHFHNLLFIDKYITIQFKIDLKPWRRFFEREKTFKVLALPTKAVLSNEYNNKTNTKDIYLGEFVHCFSNGLPKYRIILYYKSSIDFKNIISPVQTIDVNSKLGKNFVNCYFYLLSFDLGKISFVSKHTVYIRPFVYFKWNDSHNVYYEGQILECISKQYIPILMTITQVHGISLVNVTNHYIFLDNLIGDIYNFVCLWKASNELIYTRNLEFMFNKPPEFACQLFHVPTYGSLVQCGHNGYPADEYEVTASVYSRMNQVDMELNSAIDNVRISYYMTDIQISTVCTVKSTVYKSFEPIQYWVDETIVDLYYYKFGLSNQSKSCYQYRDSVETMDVIVLTNVVKTVKVPLFTLDLDDWFYFDLPLCVAILIFCLLVIIGFYGVVFKISKHQKPDISINRLLHINRRRNLEDRIILELQLNQELMKKSLMEKFTMLSQMLMSQFSSINDKRD